MTPRDLAVGDGQSVAGPDHKGGGKGTGRGGRGKSKDVTFFTGGIVDPSTARLLLCCVDDTDDLSAQTSTGYVAERIAGQVADLGGQVVLGITRHQLLLSELVPYTSHNSSMCFAALAPLGSSDAVYACAVEALGNLCADSADPGLCVAELPADKPDDLRAQIDRLMAFGRKAQVEVCTKDEAYVLASEMPWMKLSEHGGTGQGIIGALAGVGLRLSGNDGRFRGTWDLGRVCPVAPPDVSVGSFRQLLSERVGGPVRVVDKTGSVVDDEMPLLLASRAKPILFGGALTIVAETRDGVACPCGKAELGQMGSDESSQRSCSRFAGDNDLEECADDATGVCGNCLYRRWTRRGFECVIDRRADMGAKA